MNIDPSSFIVYCQTCLLNQADSNTVLLRSVEWVDSVTEVFSDDPILSDAGSLDSSSNNLRPLLREELVPLGSTSVLVSITAYANLGVRVSLEGLDDLIDLELFAVADIPLVDDEEYVALE